MYVSSYHSMSLIQVLDTVQWLANDGADVLCYFIYCCLSFIVEALQNAMQGTLMR